MCAILSNLLIHPSTSVIVIEDFVTLYKFQRAAFNGLKGKTIYEKGASLMTLFKFPAPLYNGLI